MTTVISGRTSDSVERDGLTPDALALLADLDSPAFLFGFEKGWWREVRWDFPHVYIAIGAAKRVGAPDEFVFQLECSRYRDQAPLCLQWDPATEREASIGLRPAGTGRVAIIFRTDWENGRYLYTPLDRHALKSHSDWPKNRPRAVWTPTSTITRYLTEIHDLLNSPDYSGVGGT